jgi:hypothetical protein
MKRALGQIVQLEVGKVFEIYFFLTWSGCCVQPAHVTND